MSEHVHLNPVHLNFMKIIFSFYSYSSWFVLKILNNVTFYFLMFTDELIQLANGIVPENKSTLCFLACLAKRLNFVSSFHK